MTYRTRPFWKTILAALAPSRQPARENGRQPRRALLSVEALEDRAMPSVTPLAVAAVPHAAGTPPTAKVATPTATNPSSLAQIQHAPSTPANPSALGQAGNAAAHPTQGIVSQVHQQAVGNPPNFDHVLDFNTDFLGTPDASSSFSAVTSVSTPWSSDSNGNVTVSLDVDRQASWVKAASKTDTVLLQHEQGHFDIAALAVRQVYNNPTVANASSILGFRDSSGVDHAGRISALQNLYDQEVNHGLNQDMQNKWNAELAQLKSRPDGSFDELERFANSLLAAAPSATGSVGTTNVANLSRVPTGVSAQLSSSLTPGAAGASMQAGATLATNGNGTGRMLATAPNSQVQTGVGQTHVGAPASDGQVASADLFWSRLPSSDQSFVF